MWSAMTSLFRSWNMKWSLPAMPSSGRCTTVLVQPAAVYAAVKVSAVEAIMDHMAAAGTSVYCWPM